MPLHHQADQIGSGAAGALFPADGFNEEIFRRLEAFLFPRFPGFHISRAFHRRFFLLMHGRQIAEHARIGLDVLRIKQPEQLLQRFREHRLIERFRIFNITGHQNALHQREPAVHFSPRRFAHIELGQQGIICIRYHAVEQIIYDIGLKLGIRHEVPASEKQHFLILSNALGNSEGGYVITVFLLVDI